MTTVYGSLASTASMVFQRALPEVAILPQRWSEGTTSAEVISLPLWNFTFFRSVIVYRRPPSATVWLSASMGTGVRLLS